MTKKEIVRAISQDVGLPKSKTREIVQKTFDAIIDALVNEGRIELRNFGIFEVKKRAARPGRNPRTGDEILVPERYVVNFKPGKVMEDRVKRLNAKSISEAIAEAMERERAAEATEPSQTDPQA
jgi:nucleoid DNA-binding protein